MIGIEEYSGLIQQLVQYILSLTLKISLQIISVFL